MQPETFKAENGSGIVNWTLRTAMIDGLCRLCTSEVSVTNENPDAYEAIQCPNCGHLNEDSPNFCRSCGGTLRSPSYADLAETVASPADIAQIQNEIAQITRQLNAIESKLGLRPTVVPFSKAATQPASVALSPITPPNSPPRSQTPPPRRYGWFRPEATNARRVRNEEEVAESSLIPDPTPPEANYWNTIDWEAVMGRNWFAIIGSIALALGAAFFLRLAIENDWISETDRVVLGFFGGLVLLGLGEYTAKRIPRWSQPVTGGGIAVLYLSTYSAFAFYTLLSTVDALATLLVIVSVASFLSIRYNSLIIALMSITGAFLTPILLASDLSDQPFLLLGYVLVIDLEVLAVGTFRNWRWFGLIGLIGTYSLFGGWITGISDDDLILAQMGISGAFLIFAGATTLSHIAWKRAVNPYDLALMTLNAVAYYGVTFGLLWADYEAWFGIISLCLSAFYGTLGFLSLKRVGSPPLIKIYMSAIAMLFLTLAAPLQLEGNLITIAWATEGALLIWVGFATQNYRVRLFALGVLAVAVSRLLTLDTFAIGAKDFNLFINDRFLTFAISIVAFYIAAFLYRRGRRATINIEHDIFNGLLVTANILTLWILTAEIVSFYEKSLFGTTLHESLDTAHNAQISAVTISWTLYAMGLLIVAFRQRSVVLRGLGITLVTLVTAKFVLYDTFALKPATSSLPFGWNFYFLSVITLLVVLIFTAFNLARHRKQLFTSERKLYPVAVILANVIALWGLSVESWRFLTGVEEAGLQNLESAKQLALTVLWAVYSIGLLTIGVLKRSRTMRLAAIALIMLPIAKLFAFDLFLLEQSYRVTAFISLGIMLLALSLAYQRYSETLRGFFMAQQSDRFIESNGGGNNP